MAMAVWILVIASCAREEIAETSRTERAPTVKKIDQKSAKFISQIWQKLNANQTVSREELKRLVAISKKNPHIDDAFLAALKVYESHFDYGGLAYFIRELPPTDERIDWLAYALIQDHQYAAAIALLSPLIEKNPENLLRRWRLGYALTFDGRADEAVPHIEKALPSLEGEEVVEANNLLGTHHLEQGNLEAAKKHFEAALSRDPTALQALQAMAAIHERQGESTKAQAYLEKSVEVRNQRSQEKVKLERLNRQLARLNQLFEKAEWEACEKLIAEMKQAASADEIAHLDRMNAMVQTKKRGGQNPK